MAANRFLDGRSHPPYISLEGRFEGLDSVFRGNGFNRQRRTNANPMSTASTLPMAKNGVDRNTSPHGDDSRSRTSAGQTREEGREDPFLTSSILIHQEDAIATPSKRTQKARHRSRSHSDLFKVSAPGVPDPRHHLGDSLVLKTPVNHRERVTPRNRCSV